MNKEFWNGFYKGVSKAHVLMFLTSTVWLLTIVYDVSVTGFLYLINAIVISLYAYVGVSK